MSDDVPPRRFWLLPVFLVFCLASLWGAVSLPAYAAQNAPVPAVSRDQALQFTLEQGDIVSWGRVRAGLTIRMGEGKAKDFATLTAANIGRPLTLFLGPMEVETVAIRGPVVTGTIILARLPPEKERLVLSFLSTPQKKPGETAPAGGVRP